MPETPDIRDLVRRDMLAYFDGDEEKTDQMMAFLEKEVEKFMK